MPEFSKCDFCSKEGIVGVDLVEEDYLSPITGHDTTRLGCRDKMACLQRQDDTIREWQQAMGRKPKTTIWHMCISLDNLLKLYLSGKGRFLTDDKDNPLSEIEVYHFVAAEKAKGYKYFSGCDNRDSEGKCQGHIKIVQS